MMKTAVKVKGIDHVVLHVRDLDRSKKFYIDLLGMTVNHEGPGRSFLWCGEQQVALFEERDEVHGGKEMNHMALRLEAGEYEDVKATLEANGVQVSGRPGDPHCIYFDDPDGHRLQVLTLAEQH